MNQFEQQVHAILRHHIDTKDFAGATVRIRQADQLVVQLVEGTSDQDPGFVLKPDTIFGMMSLTKPIVAACALALVSEGKMALTDPVERWIPAFSHPRMVRTLRPGESYLLERFPPEPEVGRQPEFDYAPARRSITVHDLMSFTSGLQTIGIVNPALPPVGPTDTLADWVDKLHEVPLEFQPGTQWHYSNATGYDVLGRIVEVASGVSLDDFARKTIFEPCGMKDTAFGVRDWMLPRLAPLGPFATLPIARPNYYSGSAGIFSTAPDVESFGQMLLNDGKHQQREVLPAQAVMTMRTNQIGTLAFPGIRASQYARPVQDGGSRSFRYGYGVGIVTAPSDEISLPVGSYGWDGIGTRRLWVVPKLDMVVVMLMTGIGMVAEPAHRAIERLAAETFG